MSNRETVIEFVSKLPEEMSLAQIAREIGLLAGIQTAREQARRREGIPARRRPQTRGRMGFKVI